MRPIERAKSRRSQFLQSPTLRQVELLAPPSYVEGDDVSIVAEQRNPENAVRMK
jgi:hypothetical protein